MITAKRKKIIEAALSWEGTPYHHHARVKGAQGGVDCAMFVFGVGIDAGIVEEQMAPTLPVYSPEWHLHNREELLLEALVRAGCNAKAIDKRTAGDIIAFKFGRVASHLAVLLEDNYIIHARVDLKKVVRHQLAAEWIDRMVAVYSYPGVR